VKVSISGCPPRPQLLVAGPRRAPKCFEQFPPWRIRSWPMTMDDALNCCTRDELCPTPRKWPRSVKRQPSSIRASFCRWMQIWLSAAKSLLFVVVDAQCGPWPTSFSANVANDPVVSDWRKMKIAVFLCHVLDGILHPSSLSGPFDLAFFGPTRFSSAK